MSGKLPSLFKFLLAVVFVGVINLGYVSFSAYLYAPKTTHGGLTQEIITLYTATAPPSGKEKINAETAENIIQGSIDEDSPAIRCLNHFYDPIRNIGIEGGKTSKDWALEDAEVGNEYSWPKAIRYYAQGDEEKAFIALGHVLHLLEDAAVPEHTRNDPHIGHGLTGLFTNESPYEDWADEFKNRETLRGLALRYREQGIRPKKFSSISDAFDHIARYANTNFFSRDSVSNSLYQYALPKITRIRGQYAYGVDSISGETVKLLIATEAKDGSIDLALMHNDDDAVLSDYFDRLALQLLPTGAGVIALFFEEATLARAAYQEEQMRREKEGFISKVENIGRLFARNVTYGGELLVSVGSLVAGSGEIAARSIWQHGAEKIAEEQKKMPITIGNIEREILPVPVPTSFLSQPLPAKTPAILPTPAAIIPPADLFALSSSSRSSEESTSEVAATSSVTALPVSFAATGNEMVSLPYPGFGGGGVVSQVVTVVSSLLSVGEPFTAATSSQLQESPTTSPASLLSPPLISASSTPPTSFPPSTILSPVPVLTSLECTDAFSLYVADCVSNRAIHLSWSVATGSVDHYELYSNDVLFRTTTGTSMLERMGDNTYIFFVVAVTSSGERLTSNMVTVPVVNRPVIISEIAWAGTAASLEHQWIELYNTTNYPLSLDRFALNSSDTNLHLPLSGTIAPYGYYLIENGNDLAVSNIAADLVVDFSQMSGGSRIATEGERLTLTYTLDEEGTVIIDETPERGECGGWCAGSIAEQASMERHNTEGSGNFIFNWRTNNLFTRNGRDANGQQINGTPRAPNLGNVVGTFGYYCPPYTASFIPGWFSLPESSTGCHYLSTRLRLDIPRYGELYKGVVGSSTILNGHLLGAENDSVQNGDDLASPVQGDRYFVAQYEVRTNSDVENFRNFFEHNANPPPHASFGMVEWYFGVRP